MGEGRCRHPDCMYHDKAKHRWSEMTYPGDCRYIDITGQTRLGAIRKKYGAGVDAKRLTDPANCPMYEPEPGCPKRPPTEPQAKKQLYVEGKSDREIAEIIGCSRSTICSWRSRNNLPPNVRPRKNLHERHES